MAPTTAAPRRWVWCLAVALASSACAAEITVADRPTATIDTPGQDTTITLGEAVSFAGSAEDPDGTIVSHRWTFGDGESSDEEDPGLHLYASTGVYDVAYRATDDDGQTSDEASRTVTVVEVAGQPPTATIEAPSRDTTVSLGEAVDFRGGASDPDGTVVSHAWTFGDGGTSTLEDPGGYTYAGGGVYDVTYRVTDDDGLASPLATRTVTVTVAGNQAPVAAIEAPGQDTTVALGDAVDFEGGASDPDGTVVSHAWTFGDGGTSTVEDPGSYTYAGVGTYDVTYRVTDDEGTQSATATRRVSVVAPGSNYALRFYGAGVNDIDRVKIPIDDPATSQPGPPADVGATDFTIEFWMRALPGENQAGPIYCAAFYTWIAGNIVIDRDRLLQGRTYGISISDGRITFGVQNAGGSSYTVCGATRVDDGDWHHVAVTRVRDTGALAIWVDGSLDGSATGPSGDISYPDDGVPRCGPACGSPDPYIVIGAEKHDADPGNYPSYSGWMDELRFSTVRRYTTGFTPPSTRFVPDASTAALYHFDEGSGTVIGDSSGAPGGPSNGVRRVGGSPPGPAWVISGAPTGNE